MRYLAATADPNHFLTTVSHYLIALGGAFGAVILIIIGAKVLIAGVGSRGRDEGESGLRSAFEAAGTVFVGLLFIFGATFLIGLMTAMVAAITK